MKNYIVEDLMSTYWSNFVFENNLGYLKYVFVIPGKINENNEDETKALIQTERQNAPDLFMLFDNHGILKISEKQIDIKDNFSEIEIANENYNQAIQISKQFIEFMTKHAGKPYLNDTIKYREHRAKEIDSKIKSLKSKIEKLKNNQKEDGSKSNDLDISAKLQPEIEKLVLKYEILDTYKNFNNEIYNHIFTIISQKMSLFTDLSTPSNPQRT